MSVNLHIYFYIGQSKNMIIRIQLLKGILFNAVFLLTEMKLNFEYLLSNKKWELPYNHLCIYILYFVVGRSENIMHHVHLFSLFFVDFYIYILFYYFFFRATPGAYRSSQARGQIGSSADGLCHSHHSVRSEPCLQPTPQLTTMPDS